MSAERRAARAAHSACSAARADLAVVGERALTGIGTVLLCSETFGELSRDMVQVWSMMATERYSITRPQSRRQTVKGGPLGFQLLGS